jgi:diguanylate cyclase (GGDEF)-like protein
VARRLTACVRETDTIARFGGDEFIVLLEDLDEDRARAIEDAEQIAHQILSQLAQPYRIKGADGTTAIDHRCTVSIGLALLDGEADEEDALRRADTAMYGAKEDGRNRVMVDAGSPSVALIRGDEQSHRRLHPL